MLTIPAMKEETVARHMTKGPHSIGHDQMLSSAHRTMRDNAIRHLPVLRGGKLVGLLSERDLHLVETLRDVNPERVPVEEAMSTEVFTVAPETPLEEAVKEMAAHRYGSAVVLDRQKVVGVLTTVDALRALVALLQDARRGTV